MCNTSSTIHTRAWSRNTSKSFWLKNWLYRTPSANRNRSRSNSHSRTWSVTVAGITGFCNVKKTAYQLATSYTILLSSQCCLSLPQHTVYGCSKLLSTLSCTQGQKRLVSTALTQWHHKGQSCQSLTQQCGITQFWQQQKSWQTTKNQNWGQVFLVSKQSCSRSKVSDDIRINLHLSKTQIRPQFPKPETTKANGNTKLTRFSISGWALALM